MAVLSAGAYAHTRGVSQQAARLARAARLTRDDRVLLLCAAWLHEAHADQVVTARRLRDAGHEALAGVVAHRGFCALRLALDGAAPLEAEFPVPRDAHERVLRLLDIAWVTTDPAGARRSPAGALRHLAATRGPRSADTRAFVAMVARLGEDTEARVLTERVAG